MVIRNGKNVFNSFNITSICYILNVPNILHNFNVQYFYTEFGNVKSMYNFPHSTADRGFSSVGEPEGESEEENWVT